MSTLAIIAITAGLTGALVWLPLPVLWWSSIRGTYYLPIVLVGNRHGLFAGLFAGVAASLLWTAVIASRGMGDMAWYSILTPDFAVIGMLGSKLFTASSRYRLARERAVIARHRLVHLPEPEANDLNSLASIQSAAGLLGEDDTPAALRQELVGLISTECAHLSDGIAGLRQQSRSAAWQQMCEADLTEIINSAVQGAEFALCGSGVTIRKEIALDLPVIQCYPDQLQDLLMSLTVTAVHSVPEGASVVVTAYAGDKQVILDLKGQGEGTLFSRLVHRLFGSRIPVTGAGLASAYDIVRRHGGRIERRLDAKKGLGFSVSLPLRRNLANGGWKGTGSGG